MTLKQNHLTKWNKPCKFSTCNSIVFILLVCCCFIEARLIQIYHRKNAATFGESSANSSMHLTLPTLSSQSNNLVQQISSRKRDSTIEYSSPMKRILELITNHHHHHISAPTIVVTNSDPPDNSVGSVSSSTTSTPPPPQSLIQNPLMTPTTLTLLPSHLAQSHIEQQVRPSQAESIGQQWTVVNTNHAIQPMFEPLPGSPQTPSNFNPYGHNQFFVNQQPQQQITSTTNHQINNQPSNFGFVAGEDGPQFVVEMPQQPRQQQMPSHLVSQRQLAPTPSNNYYQQQQPSRQNPLLNINTEQPQPQQVMQPSSGLQRSEDPVPIFLSSYVPELATAQHNQQQKQLVQTLPVQSSSSQLKLPAMPSQSSMQEASRPAQDIQQLTTTSTTTTTTTTTTTPAPSSSDSESDKESESRRDGDDLRDEDEPNMSGKGSSDPDDDKIDSDDFPDNPSGENGGGGGGGGGGGNGGGSGGDNDDDDPKNQSNVGSMSFEDKYDSDDPSATRSSSNLVNNDRKLPPSSQATAASSQALVKAGLNDECLQCICRASSGCDRDLRCITLGANEKRCGAFQLSENYWTKAGKFSNDANSMIAFEDCANDLDCAVETVTGYLRRYRRDCDNDGQITCMDFARLHRMRPNECEDTTKLNQDSEGYWQKFQTCAEGVNRSHNFENDDEF